MADEQVNPDEGCLPPLDAAAQAVVLDIDMSSSELSRQSFLSKLNSAKDSWSLKICRKSKSDDNAQMSKRRRRNSSKAGGRRRARCLQLQNCESQSLVDEGDLAPSGILNLLQTQPQLCTLERLTICDLEDAIPISSMCLFLESAANLKEITLDNVILHGNPTTDCRESSCCPSLTRVSLSSCGPAEDIFLQWVILKAKSTLVDLTLKQMLLSTSALDSIAQLSVLTTLRLESVPGLCRSNLLSNICETSLSELHLVNLVPTQWFTDQKWNLGSKLQTLSLVLFDSPQETFQGMGQFVASLLLPHEESLGNFSLKFIGSNQTKKLRGSWSHFVKELEEPLRHMKRLESLKVFVADKDGRDVVTPDSSLETVLAEGNTVLSKLVLASSQQTLRFSPAVEFYLGLNGSGRQLWLQEDQKCPDVLVGCSEVFPKNESLQLSMLFYVLSNHPSWINTVCP